MNDKELASEVRARGLIPEDRLREAELESEKERLPLAGILIRLNLINDKSLSEILRSSSRDRKAYLGRARSWMMDAPPSATPELGRYTIKKEIGEGGMGKVFVAHDRDLDREVAVKLLHERISRNEVARKRFHREARMAAGLSHPNLVTVHDVGEADGRMYLVMERVDGVPLNRLPATKEDPITRVVKLLEQAARGVAEAHRKGIVHRDLKPGNIFVTDGDVPKVGDFGLARLLDSNTNLTASESTIGTPVYMAPEQVEGSTLSPATDVYALGVILYETLAGRVPHDGKTSPEVYRKILDEDPVPPRKLRPGTDAGLEAIAMKAIEKNPRHRYPSAEEFADDLRNHLDHRPVTARPFSGFRSTRRWFAKRKATLIPSLVAAVFAVLLAILLIPMTAGPDPAKTDPLRDGRSLMKQQRFKAAILEFTDALRIDPSNAEAYRLRGDARMSTGDLDGAFTDYTQSIQIDPGKAAPWISRALVRLQRRDYRNAVSDCDNAIRLDPGAASAFGHRGQARIFQREYADAIADLTRALTLEPRRHLWYQNRASARRRFGDFEGALEDLRECLRLRPEEASTYNSRGITKAKMGRMEESIEDFSRAVSLDPKDLGARLNRAKISYNLGRLDEAIADLKTLLEIAPVGWDDLRDTEALLREARKKRGDF